MDEENKTSGGGKEKAIKQIGETKKGERKMDEREGGGKKYTVSAVCVQTILFSPSVFTQKPSCGECGHAGARGDESHRG